MLTKSTNIVNPYNRYVSFFRRLNIATVGTCTYRNPPVRRTPKYAIF
jgi:hypothetical protein